MKSSPALHKKLIIALLVLAPYFVCGDSLIYDSSCTLVATNSVSTPSTGASTTTSKINCSNCMNNYTCFDTQRELAQVCQYNTTISTTVCYGNGTCSNSAQTTYSNTTGTTFTPIPHFATYDASSNVTHIQPFGAGYIPGNDKSFIYAGGTMWNVKAGSSIPPMSFAASLVFGLPSTRYAQPLYYQVAQLSGYGENATPAHCFDINPTPITTICPNPIPGTYITDTDGLGSITGTAVTPTGTESGCCVVRIQFLSGEIHFLTEYAICVV